MNHCWSHYYWAHKIFLWIDFVGQVYRKHPSKRWCNCSFQTAMAAPQEVSVAAVASVISELESIFHKKRTAQKGFHNGKDVFTPLSAGFSKGMDMLYADKRCENHLLRWNLHQGLAKLNSTQSLDVYLITWFSYFAHVWLFPKIMIY